MCSGSAAQTTISVKVTSGSNDRYLYTTSGSGNSTATSLFIGTYGGERLMSVMRFQGLTIPAGATITSAYLKVSGPGATASTVQSSILAHDADNSTIPSAGSDVLLLPQTSASTAWTLTPSSSTSPNISAVVQEVVSRSGWSSGNAVTLMVKGTEAASTGTYFVFSSYEAGASVAPTLEVTYTTAPVGTILFIRDQAGSYTTEEQARVTQFQAWGYTVTPLQASSSQSSFNSALASADVVYVSEEVASADVAYKLRETDVGVVNEERVLISNFGFASSSGTSTGTALSNVSSSHAVTDGFASSVTIFSASDSLAYLSGSIAPGAESLATDGSGNTVLTALEIGATLADTYNGNSTAAGRRVQLPWHANTFSWSTLTSDALTLARQAIEWAADDGLVGHWKFDEASGTTAVDSSDYGINGTFTNGATPGSTGIKGYAGDFDGTDDHVAVNGGSIHNTRENFTIACWAKSDTATWSGWGCLVSKRHSWVLHPSYNGTHLYFHVANSAGNQYSGDFDMAQVGGIQGWHHYVGVYDGSAGEIKLYIDGVLRQSSTFTPGSLASSNTSQMTIGKDSSYSSADRHFDGQIDDVRLYSRALTDTEVLQLYGPVHHWKLDEGTGTTLADSGPGSASATFDDGLPVWTTGVRGNALDFGGSSDVETDGDFDPPETGSVALWFREAATPIGNERLLGNDGNWEIRTDATGTIYCDFDGGGGGGSFNSSSGFAAAGRWRHLIASYNAVADRYTIYLDGQLYSSGSFTCSDPAANVLTFGSRTGSAERFNGAIDDVVIYDRMVTPRDAAELYGLVGHWKMDELSGSVAADSSGLDNDMNLWNGVTVGAVGPYPGEGDYAAEFDGVDDNGAATSIEAYENINEYVSIAGWVRFDTAIADQTEQNVILTRSEWSTKRGFILLADQPYGDRLLFRVLDGTTYGEAVWNKPSIEGGRWYYIVGTYDGTTVKLYVDGELKASASFASTIEPDAGDNVSTGWGFDGRVYDLRLYNRAMTSAEMAEAYGLVAHWKLDEAGGSIAYDSSGMGHDAVLTGSEGWTTDGQVDGAFEFDYVDGEDYFEAPNNTLLDNLQEGSFSLLAYFKPSSSPPGTGSEYNAAYALLSKQGYHTGLVYDHLNQFYLEHWRGTGPTWTGAGAWSTHPTGKFYHVAGIVDRDAGATSIYVDGVLRETTSFTSGAAAWEYGTSLWRIGISEPGTTNWNHPAHGVIDDAKLFSRALSADEVLKLYESGTTKGIRIIRWVEAK